jgi:hypothetical protein
MVGLRKYIGSGTQARLWQGVGTTNYFENLFWGRKKVRRVCARIENSRREPLKNTGKTGKKWQGGFAASGRK